MVPANSRSRSSCTLEGVRPANAKVKLSGVRFKETRLRYSIILKARALRSHGSMQPCNQPHLLIIRVLRHVHPNFSVNQHVQFGNTNTVPLRLAACTILYCCLASNSLCIQTPRRRPGHTAYHPKNCTSHSSSKQGEELCSVITSSIIQNPCPHMHTHTLATYPISF